MGTLIFVCTIHWSPWVLWTQYRDRIPSEASEVYQVKVFVPSLKAQVPSQGLRW